MSERKMSKGRILAALIVMLAAVMLVPSLTGNVTRVEAASGLAKVTGVQYKRSAKSKVKLTWAKVTGAKGHEVYMRTNKGAYKKIATTSARKCVIKKLKVGNTYYFKVRAYKVSKGKKKYGAFSNVLKRKLPSFEYMTELGLKPYAGKYEWYPFGSNFTMAGQKYTRGICFDMGYALCYNLAGKYSELDFTYGAARNDPEFTVYFYGDNELLGSVTHNQYDLPQHVTIKIKDVYQLKIQVECEKMGYESRIGFADVKLYY